MLPTGLQIIISIVVGLLSTTFTLAGMNWLVRGYRAATFHLRITLLSFITYILTILFMAGSAFYVLAIQLPKLIAMIDPSSSIWMWVYSASCCVIPLVFLVYHFRREGY